MTNYMTGGSPMLDKIRNEPVLVTNLVSAVVLLVSVFGFDLSQEQVAAIVGVSIAVMAIVARSQVTPTPENHY